MHMIFIITTFMLNLCLMNTDKICIYFCYCRIYEGLSANAPKAVDSKTGGTDVGLTQRISALKKRGNGVSYHHLPSPM